MLQPTPCLLWLDVKAVEEESMIQLKYHFGVDPDTGSALSVYLEEGCYAAWTETESNENWEPCIVSEYNYDQLVIILPDGFKRTITSDELSNAKIYVRFLVSNVIADSKFPTLF